MSWVKLDDGFFIHPKVSRLSKDAKLLFLAGLAWCTRELTDGFISPIGLRTAAAHADTKTTKAKELEAVGLWHPMSDGYVVHDYHDYQPSKAEVEERRRLRAEAGRAGGRSTQAKRQASASAHAPPNATANGLAGAQAVPKQMGNPISHNPSLSHLPVTHDPPNGPTGEEKPEAKTPGDALVERIVTIVGESPRNRRDADELIGRWRSEVAEHVIDEAIGRCESAATKPRSVAFFATAIERTASHYGVGAPR